MKIFNLKKEWKSQVNASHNWLTLAMNGNEPAEIVISGQIGKNWWDDSGISSKEFRDALNQIPRGNKINLLINSEGGSVQDGLEMYNAINERSQDVTAHISGYAVSIASVIPLAASRVISPVSSVWMIHEPWSMTQGDAEEHMKAAEMLDKHGDMLAEIYSEHTGKSKKAMRDAMQKETWFTGNEACEFGLADETEEDCDSTRASLRNLDLKNFKNVPATIQNLLRPIVAKNSADENNGGQPKNQPTVNNIMDKKKLVALLISHGIKDSAGKDLTENSSDADFEAALNILAKKPGADANARMQAIEAKMELAETKRLTDKINSYVEGGKITKAEVAIYVKAAREDETGTLKVLDEKEAVSIGGAAASSGIEVTAPAEPFGLIGKPTEKLRNLMASCNGDRKKAYAALRDNWNDIYSDGVRRDKVRNENTISSSLTTNFLILGATTQLSPKFASIRMFSRDTSVDPYKPLATGQMKFTTTPQDGSTTQTNATNFESGDSTVTNVAITVNQYTEAFHLTNGQLNSGIRMEDLVTAKLASLGSKISKILAANITAANYSTLTPIINSSAAFGFSDMQTAWGQLKKATRKHVMLDGPYLAKLTNIPSLFQPTPVVPGAGWENLIGWDYVALHTEWSAAGNNIIGFACDPQALGVIAGLPLIDSPAIPGGILAQATGTLPGVDLPIAVYSWFNTSTRTYWASFDMMFGANALDTTAGLVIASGTPS